MKSTVRFMKNLWCDEVGATAAEYALILALVEAREKGLEDVDQPAMPSVPCWWPGRT